ncbi:MAG: pyruvate formate lyase-activating protein [Zestosphaera tikiterensis]|uniref:Pyruvate formate lyase-activating protein n=1 Tax=Zestosphaera tikiterensis TaxID=1973259 RepID=A0A2R7Y6Q6_9CREN|nr:MAG: pyruvate formate lyase-activating protein [Zestosphaera tikiterensis]
MFDVVKYVAVIRPDSVRVWKDRHILEKLSWYVKVMRGVAPPKYVLVKNLPAELRLSELTQMSFEDLMNYHTKLQNSFKSFWLEVMNSSNPWKGVKLEGLNETTFLDVKIELLNKVLNRCELCEWRCGVNRNKGEVGFCRVVGSDAYVDNYFHHVGEEAPLVPSGTIFYVGCNFRCVYCQNWSISQRSPNPVEHVDEVSLANIQEWLSTTGSKNINHVGGEPTPNMLTIIKSLKHLKIKTPQLWNSNMYMSMTAMKVLEDVIDIWLPDLKYGNNECGLKYSLVKNYFDIVTRNIKEAHENGDMIIRHLILPGHVECCTRKVLEWTSNNVKRAIVNIMDQYRPEYLVLKYPDRWREINRRISLEELNKAYNIAREYGYEGPVEDLWYIR